MASKAAQFEEELLHMTNDQKRVVNSLKGLNDEAITNHQTKLNEVRAAKDERDNANDDARTAEAEITEAEQ